MASINGYPHIDMHVRDDSIATPLQTEILPLSKPLYIMKAQRGVIGVPVWCPTYSDAVKEFGADTFNSRSKYFSENAYFLKKTFPFNGAFIMRVASTAATDARISIEIGLSKADPATGLPTANIPQFKRDVNGNFELELNGSKIPINSDGKTKDEFVESGADGEFVQAVLPGYKIAWRATVRPNTGDPRELGVATTASTENFTWYPMVDIKATNPGAWGSCYGIKLYFDTSANTLAGTISNGAATVSLAPVELLQDATSATPVVDAFGASCVNGVLKPDVVDADTGVDLTLNGRVKTAYQGKQALPLEFSYLSDNWNVVGKELMKAELAVREKALELYPFLDSVELGIVDHGDGTTSAVYGARTYVDDLFSKVATESDIGGSESLAGFMVNSLSVCTCDGVPYFAACIVGSDDELVAGDTRVNVKDVIIPSGDTPIFLGGGEDGEMGDWNIEEYIRAQISSAIAGAHDYLNDYWHCPFNMIYDTGYSIKTKKALIDFTAVRDNLVAVISSQITWKKNEADINPPMANSRMDDESIASALRAYALLMKEDVENGTGACRCVIFCHAGKTSDHNDQWVPYTLWYALKNAEYLNRPFLAQEPKELPHSAVDCFVKTSWTAAQEETKSRVWNAGVNYVQHYGMGDTDIHFAAVRSVYWYETSILVDAGVVNALVFCKDLARKSWSRWAGSTREAGELNKLIKADLDGKLAYMLHGKFRFVTRVYQTAEDMELGFQRHVDIELWSAGQNRVWKCTIICKREGFNEE